MSKMKKAVQKVLEANAMPPQLLPKKGFMDTGAATIVDYTASQAEFTETMRIKRIEVEKFQDRARRIVEAMRVPDLTFIPIR